MSECARITSCGALFGALIRLVQQSYSEKNSNMVLGLKRVMLDRREGVRPPGSGESDWQEQELGLLLAPERNPKRADTSNSRLGVSGARGGV